MHKDQKDEKPNQCEGSATVNRVHGRPYLVSCQSMEIKGYPYFQCLKENNCFAWTRECEEAFAKLKEYLASPLVLGKSILGTPFCLYFSITNRAINSVILQDQDKIQKPVYFVSKVL